MTIDTVYADLPEEMKIEFDTIKAKIKPAYLEAVELHIGEFINAFLNNDAKVEHLNNSKVNPVLWAHGVNGKLGNGPVTSEAASKARNSLELHLWAYGIDSKYDSISVECIADMEQDGFANASEIVEAFAEHSGRIQDLNNAKVNVVAWARAVSGTLGGPYKVSSEAASNATNIFELYCLSYRVAKSNFKGISNECLSKITDESICNELAKALASGADVKDLNSAQVLPIDWAGAVNGTLEQNSKKISGEEAAKAPDRECLVALCRGVNNMEELRNNAAIAFKRNESVAFCNIIDKAVEYNIVDLMNIEDFLYRAKEQHNSTDGMLNKFYTHCGLNDYQFIINHLENLPEHV